VPLADGKSLLELTIRRLLPMFARENIWVITRDAQVRATERITRPFGVRILSEPAGRNTAACIAYGATLARRVAGDPAVVFLPADHLVRDSAAFRSALGAGLRFVARHDLILTLGIRPTRPATGFGYIARGRRLGLTGRHEVFAVEGFTEKPTLARARRLARSGKHLWNAGVFLARASVMLGEIGVHLPRVARPFSALEKHLGSAREAPRKRRCYRAVPDISIDFGVMEKSRRTCVMPADIGWDDLGNWESYSRYVPGDRSGNRVRGAHVGLDSRDCVIYSDKGLVATVGVEGVIVVVTDDAILVAGREAAERVKDLAGVIKDKGFGRLL
jgi:mannose-1-phosphate guanylyltransferase